MTLRAMRAGTYIPGRASHAVTGHKREARLRDKLVLQEWGLCGWVGNPPKENKVLISKDAQLWISADQMM